MLSTIEYFNYSEQHCRIYRTLLRGKSTTNCSKLINKSSRESDIIAMLLKTMRQMIAFAPYVASNSIRHMDTATYQSDAIVNFNCDTVQHRWQNPFAALRTPFNWFRSKKAERSPCETLFEANYYVYCIVSRVQLRRTVSASTFFSSFVRCCRCCYLCLSVSLLLFINCVVINSQNSTEICSVRSTYRQ